MSTEGASTLPGSNRKLPCREDLSEGVQLVAICELTGGCHLILHAWPLTDTLILASTCSTKSTKPFFFLPHHLPSCIFHMKPLHEITQTETSLSCLHDRNNYSELPSSNCETQQRLDFSMYNTVKVYMCEFKVRCLTFNYNDWVIRVHVRTVCVCGSPVRAGL